MGRVGIVAGAAVRVSQAEYRAEVAERCVRDYREQTDALRTRVQDLEAELNPVCEEVVRLRKLLLDAGLDPDSEDECHRAE